ncbi:MAG: P-loop NTPase [Rhodospirillales bacterium]|nr:P-loop NTPase [Rhodospirillales bacterium]
MSLISPAVSAPPPAAAAAGKRARVLVIGNEKGGSGKSTVAMHLVVGFLRAGFKVGSLDLDVRQASLTRYLENRAAFAAGRGVPLPMPTHRRGPNPVTPADATAEVAALTQGHDLVIVDTPGRVDDVSMAVHVLADVIVTPVGESHLDLDLIGAINRRRDRAVKPGPYAEFVWSVRQQRARAGLPPSDWFVCHNRRRQPETRVGREVGRALADLASRFAFKLIPGFSERTIFQELFPDGLTLLDLREAETGVGLTMSHVAARAEIRRMVEALSPAGTFTL